MSRKVFMYPLPSFAKDDTSNSINQIVLRLQEYLPMYGWDITETLAEADICAVHAGTNTDIGVDVAHCHGLYPTAIYDEPDKQWHYKANYNVEYTLRLARKVTVPSAWVADILRRDMNINPVIVPWGIARHDWQKGQHQGYTLWNKTRPDRTCDPSPIEHLASRIQDASFVSTFSNLRMPPANLKVTGRMTYEQMKTVIQSAALYLGTTKETWGIGTLEAMACGIPVLGYRWGATPDIVEHGVHGYLVEPYDLDGLVEGWRWCMKYRKMLSYNARRKAIEDFYLWERVAGQMAEVYDESYELKQGRSPIKVSVVIPCHNYARFLAEAFTSVAMQEAPFSFEIIVVDDASDDDSAELAERLYNADFNGRKALGKLIRLDTNVGVADARNIGIEAAAGEFIVCLDADDRLGSASFLSLLANELDANPFLGLVYTGLGTFRTGDPYVFMNAWPPEYDPKLMLGQNQVPTCNMFRKRAWEQAGKYKTHYTPAEDAALWLGMAMSGWMIEKVTNEALFYYRVHPDSLSSSVRKGEKREPNWRMAFDGTPIAGYPLLSIMPPADDKSTHPVRNYDKPVVSVIIPVGAGHETIVQRAIDSVRGQTEWRWECIVVNDTGKPMTYRDTWVKEVIPKAGGNVGTGAARNAGAAIAEGKYLVFLDADDYLKADYLERVLLHSRVTGRYVYTDTQLEEDGKFTKVNESQEYLSEGAVRAQLHPITALIPKDWFDRVGGFNESLSSWEDWDLFIRMAIMGFCGSRLAETLFIYGFDLGQRRNLGADQSKQLKDRFYQTYKPFIEKEQAVCKCDELVKSKTANLPDELTDDLVRVILIKGGAAKAPIVGYSGKRYARAQLGDTLLVSRQDYEAEPNRFRPVGFSEDISGTPLPPPPDRYTGDISSKLNRGY